MGVMGLEESGGEVGDEVDDGPGAGDPVPVEAGERDVEGVFGVDAVGEEVEGHDEEFADAGEDVEEVQGDDPPHGGGVGVVVPAEVESLEFEVGAGEGGEADED